MTNQALSASDIAKYIISLSCPDEGDLLSHLKLQKLLYYAQGVYLAITGDPLFNESVYAWEHGPVVPEIYQEYKYLAASPIPLPEYIDFSIYTDEQKEIMDDVYSVFGQFSAWKLREMTHSEPPWMNSGRNQVIPRKQMKEYFETQLIDD